VIDKSVRKITVYLVTLANNYNKLCSVNINVSYYRLINFVPTFHFNVEKITNTKAHHYFFRFFLQLYHY
jgi:hypothetical protein